MKKIFTIAAIAAATVLSASCAKEIEGEFQKEGIIAHASLQPVEATKAIGEYSYNIVWEENDKIAVLDNANNIASFSLKEGAGSTTGTFQQEGTDALSAPLTAYYPASVVADDKSLVWPATQADVKNITNVPMTAESSTATGEVNFAFKHLGSVLQLVLTAKNGEINVKQIDITADQGLSGAFTVENGAAVISNTGTTISTGDISDKNIKLSATASYLNFAVPSGSFTNFAITITDTNDKEYSLSAASLTLERAMVNKVTFAMDAKDPAVFEVNVNGHTVRVKLADDITAHDVLTEVYVDGSSVIVKAYSTSGQHLKCTMPGGEFCTDQSKNPTDDIASRYDYTFTISGITSNTTATIGYAEIVDDIAVSPAGVGCKVTVVNGELYEGELVRLVPNAAYSYGISNWKDQNGNVLCDGYDYTVRLSKDVQITACFEENLILGGEFSVKDDKGNVKKVRFTRGNLYCNDRTQYEIEQHQYDFNPIYTNDAGYISHFMWSNNKGYARFTQYDSRWDGQGPLFTEAEDFKVIDAAHCLSIDEWSYLVNERAASTVNSMANARYFMGCVQKDDGKSINGMFLFPDEFTWPESVIAHPSGINGPVNEFSDNNYSYNDLKRLQDAGVVFLPAAGYRDGGNGPYADNYMIYNVGRSGFYWSSTKSKESATFIWINSSGISLKSAVLSKAYSIRLVTESN